MKKALIVSLLCLNAVLLAALVVTSNAPAVGQNIVLQQNEYLMVTAKIKDNYDIVFLLDTAKQRLAALRVDQTSKKFVWYPIRDLKNDFKR